MPAEIVLFDLGGVLTEFRGAAALKQLTGARSEQEIWNRWLRSPWVRRFEAGDCSPREFADGVVTEWDLQLSPEQFVEAFTYWLQDPFEGAEQLVRDTSRRATVGCLSNTNSLHWRHVIGRWPMLDLFTHRFLSFELGMVKPDREIFQYVTTSLGVDPKQILFLDDNMPNVESARACGMHSDPVRGVAQARLALQARGLLD